MKFNKTNDIYADLIQKLKTSGYSKSYVERLETEINWLIRNQNREDIQSYGDACRIRISRTKSREMQTTYRRVYKTLENFDLYGKYPSGVYAGTSARRGSYWQLNPVFREVVDAYKDTGEKRGLKDTTIYKTSFSASSFLLAMQKRGRAALNDITEDDVISYFIREGGRRPLSGGCRDTLAAVFKSDLGVHTEAARQILAYIPVIRQRRKNIPYLKPEEADAIRNALSCPDSGLCMRNRAIGTLLFFTGIRGCDLLSMKLSDIDWEKEEIYIIQQKTGVRLTLPMPAAVGNAIRLCYHGTPFIGGSIYFSMQGKALRPTVTWIGLGSCFKSLQGCGCQAGRRGTAGNAPVPSSCGISPCGERHCASCDQRNSRPYCPEISRLLPFS
jgi:integrase